MVSDPYKVLGVSKDATPEEIKKAYRAMARKYHPDMHPNDPSATEKMNEINEAYDMLTNPAKYERAQARSGYGSSGSSNGYGSSSSSYGNSSYGSSGYGNSGYGSSGYGNSSYGNSDYGSGNSSYGGRYGWAGNFGYYDFFGGNYGGQNASVNPTQQPGDSQAVVRAINFINAGQYPQAISTLGSITSTNRNARWYYLCGLAYYGAGDMTHATDFMRKASEMEPNNNTYAQLLNQFMGKSQSESSTTYYSSGGSGTKSILRRLLFPIIAIILFNLLLGGSCFGCSGCLGNSCFGSRSNSYSNYYGNPYGYYSNSESSTKYSNNYGTSSNSENDDADAEADEDAYYNLYDDDDYYGGWYGWF